MLGERAAATARPALLSLRLDADGARGRSAAFDDVRALAGLDGAVATFRRVVEGLTAEQLAAPHPEARFGQVYPALLKLLAHFALHRGQMSYIARLAQRK